MRPLAHAASTHGRHHAANVDDATFAWLRERASTRGTSLNAELLEILAVARADELALELPGPAAASVRLARKHGVRTRRSGDLLRGDRDTRR